LQADKEIVIETIALFAALKYLKRLSNDEIENELLKLSSDIVTYNGLPEADVKKQMAGLLFSVPPKVGFQLLFWNAITDIITTKNVAKFVELSSNYEKAFWIAFDSFLAKSDHRHLIDIAAPIVKNGILDSESNNERKNLVCYTNNIKSVLLAKSYSYPKNQEEIDKLCAMLNILSLDVSSNYIVKQVLIMMVGESIKQPAGATTLLALLSQIDKYFHVHSIGKQFIAINDITFLFDWVNDNNKYIDLIVPDENIATALANYISSSVSLPNGLLSVVDYVYESTQYDLSKLGSGIVCYLNKLNESFERGRSQAKAEPVALKLLCKIGQRYPQCIQSLMLNSKLPDYLFSFAKSDECYLYIASLIIIAELPIIPSILELIWRRFWEKDSDEKRLVIVPLLRAHPKSVPIIQALATHQRGGPVPSKLAQRVLSDYSTSKH
jgi:hypothetical protein